MSDKITFTLHELVMALDDYADGMLTAKFGLTANQFIFLATCADVEPTDVTRLAECLGISKAGVSKRLPAMVAAGWVTASEDPGHGRRVVIALTSQARELVEQAGRALDDRFRALFSDPRARDIDPVRLNRELNLLTTLLLDKGALS